LAPEMLNLNRSSNRYKLEDLLSVSANRAWFAASFQLLPHHDLAFHGLLRYIYAAKYIEICTTLIHLHSSQQNPLSNRHDEVRTQVRPIWRGTSFDQRQSRASKPTNTSTEFLPIGLHTRRWIMPACDPGFIQHIRIDAGLPSEHVPDNTHIR
jgi:hypothetical protein